MRFKAVVFDLDGTLVDTIGDIAVAMNRMLGKHGWTALDRSSYRSLVAEGMRSLVSRSIPVEMREPAAIEECMREFEEEYSCTAGDSAVVYPGIDALLEGVLARGLKTAVHTNTPDAIARKVVLRLLGKWPFDYVVGVGEGLPDKPDPAGALAISRMMCIHPSHVLYLGDSGVDMRTSLAAGMFPVGALWGFRSREELVAAGAARVVSEPTQVLPILG